MGLLRVLGPKVVEEPERRADQDGEAGHSHGRLGAELEEGDQHRYGNSTSTDSADRAQGHDETEYKHSHYL